MGATDMAYGGHPQLASRGLRLGAFLLDGVIWVAAWVFCFFMFGFLSELLGSMAAAGAIIPVLGVLGVNLYLLADNGQTLGKRALGIKIVRSDLRTPASIWRIIFFRYIPIHLLSNLPCIGSLLYLANFVLIFRQDQRCGHDHIADTNVINADADMLLAEPGYGESVNQATYGEPYSSGQEAWSIPDEPGAPSGAESVDSFDDDPWDEGGWSDDGSQSQW